MAKMKHWQYVVLYNLLLPFVLIIAFLLRVNFASFVYLVFCLFIPTTVSSPSAKYPSHPKRLLLCLALWALACLCAQAAYNVVPKRLLKSTALFDIARSPRRKAVEFRQPDECKYLVSLLTQIGLGWVRVQDGIQPIFAAFAPDVIVFVMCSALYARIRAMQRSHFFGTFSSCADTSTNQMVNEARESIFTDTTDISDCFRPEPTGLWNSRAFNNSLFCVFCCLAGCIYPCLLSAPYFSIFLFLSTSWAFRHTPSRRTLTALRQFVNAFTFAHICVLYVYQLPNMNEQLSQTHFISRLFGFVQYIPDPCSRVTEPFPVESWAWPETLYPFLLLVLHWTACVQLTAQSEHAEFFLSSSFDSSSSRNLPGSSFLSSENSENESPDERSSLLISEKKSKSSKSVDKHKDQKTAGEHEVVVIVDVPRNVATGGAQNDNRRVFIGFKKRAKALLEILNSIGYVFCLLIMIAWSLLYHSWSTFVLLLTACLVWMHPKTQQLFHRLIPFIAVYAEILLLCNFVYAFPLTQDELPDENPVLLRQLGLEKPRDHAPFLDLMLKTGFCLVLWTTVRSRGYGPHKGATSGGAELLRKLSHFGNLEEVRIVNPQTMSSTTWGQKRRPGKSLVQKCSALLNLTLSNFWIFFVLTLLLAISVQDPVAFYRIIYMGLFLTFVTMFQVSFRRWRRFMYTFWMILIAYCLSLLTLLYTYQFHGIPELYVERLGLAEDVTRSLGLERFSSGRLLFRLMTPILFLIFSLIQVNYCHEKVMRVTRHWEDEVYGPKLRFLMEKLKLFYRQTNHLEGALQLMNERRASAAAGRRAPAIAATTHDVVRLPLPTREQVRIAIGLLEATLKRLLEFRNAIWNIAWHAIEIHFTKLIALYMVHVAINEVSILNVLLVGAAGALLYSEHFSTEILNVSSILSSCIVIMKMLYQLEFIRDEKVSRVCYNEALNETITVRFGDWFGLSKTDSIFVSTQNHVTLVLLLATKTVIQIRQFMHRKTNKLAEPPRGIIFPNIDRETADQDALHCILYLSNYFFYRFGVELCMIVTAITVGYRNDFLSLLYMLALLGLFLMDRGEKSRIWPYYVATLYGLFVAQYLLCLGLPDYLCWSYPWDGGARQIVSWFYLPSTATKLNAQKLFADFIQLLCASCQMFAFRLEMRYGSSYAGGSNVEEQTITVARRRHFLLSFNLTFFRVEPEKKLTKKIGVPDFISAGGHSLLDKLKEIVFMYFYWATLSIIFIAGTTRVTIFSAGYLFSAFLFLWQGNALFFQPMLNVIHLWDLLILYNLIVIFAKVLLQVIGCIYLTSLYTNFCWFIQLFGIACNNFVAFDGAFHNENEMAQILATCDIPHQESGIFYDGLCFAFLIFQRRIFGSEYFKHVIVELYAQKFFAARGAELISLIRRQEIQDATERERNVLAKVKSKMLKIKRKHDKESRRPIEEVVENPATPTTPNPSTISPSEPTTSTPGSVLPVPIVSDEAFLAAAALAAAADASIEFEKSHRAFVAQSTQSEIMQLRMRKISAPAMPTSRRDAAKMLKIPSVVEENENEDNSEEDWSVASSGDRFSANTHKKTALEGGVKGLGPLQLLNFAFKKGALSDAMKESNEIEATHDLLERQMEQTYGVADYQSIRRAILKQKARQKTKADYDENTFDEDLAKSDDDGDRASATASFLRVPAPPCVRNISVPIQSDTIQSDKHNITSIAPSHKNNANEDSGLSDFITSSEQFSAITRRASRLPQLPRLIVRGPSADAPSRESDASKLPSAMATSRLRRFRHKYAEAKEWMRDFLHNLFLFLFMFAEGVLESLISYLMRVSRNYRYIAYILHEEKRVHKELMSNASTDHKAHIMSRAGRQHHRNIIDETVLKSTVARPRTGVMYDESFQRLHRCLTARRRRTTGDNTSASTIVTTDTRDAVDHRLASLMDDERRLKLERRASADNALERDTFEKKSRKLQRSDSFEVPITADFTLTTTVESQLIPTLQRPQPTVLKLLPDEKVKHIFVKCPKLIISDNENSKGNSCRQPVNLQHRPSSTSIREEEKKESIFVRLIVAVYYAVLSRSEMICYVMIVLNHIFTASLLSMPLPLMMLLWGTLTVPKPTKHFWIVLITYTELMVVLKYVFQFGFFPWIHGAPSLDPFWPPRIIGIEKRQKYAAWDLALLMALFLHRNILMSIGLWKNEAELEAEEEREEERHHIFINKLHQQPKNIANSKRVSRPVEHKISDAKPVSVETEEPGTPASMRNTSIISILAGRRNFRVQSFAEIVSELRLSRVEIKHKVRHRVGKVRSFFGLLLNDEEERYPVDVYAPMFICDAICFLIVIFGYSSFGTDQGAGSVTAYFQENKVPGTLVAMLIIQFILMVVDRALFLRKFLFGKLGLQIFLVVFVHIWLFLLLPAATGRLFTKNFTCQLWYFVKIIYFVISAKQIRAGYPKRQLGNVISNTYSALYMFLYKIYMMIPFLFELSLLMDWMWIDTCLGLSNWITLHDIYSNVSMIKCERNIEEDYPSPKGVKQRALHKYGRGGFLLFLIILIIWFPLVLFSMANTVGTRSVPVECTAKMTIAGYQPLFESTARLGDIRSLTVDEYNDLYYTYRMSKTALSYIADYDNEDVVMARIDGNSSSRWQISPPARTSLINSLNGTQMMSIQFDWQFKRAPDENLQYGSVENFHTIELEPGSEIRAQLVEVIRRGSNRTQILIPNLFPSMVDVPGEGKSDYVNALLNEHLKSEHDSIYKAFTSVLLDLDSDDGIEWWKIRMIDPVFDPIRISEPVIRDYIVFYGFVDKVFPKSFSFITGGGILGLYVSIVLVLGHYVRGIVSDSMKKVMFEELPNVDRLLQLCNDIFLVRDAGEFGLEEDLFAKLVFIFRSPATLIKWTRENPQ